MSITFSCEHCGKAFTLDDKFAGKKGRCKGCGALMMIPSHASSASAIEELFQEEVAPRRSPATTSSRSARDEVSTARRPSSATSKPAAVDDPYGFDDEPLPPRAPIGFKSYDDDDDEGPLLPASKKKKKKSVGFFASSGGNSSAAGRVDGGWLMIRVVIALIGLGASSLVLPGVRSTLIPGWAFQSDIEAFVKRQIDLTNELTGILKTVNDVPSAAIASSRANDTIHKLERNLTENKDRKGLQKDIDEMKIKYSGQQQLALQNFTNEFTRVCSIEGALEALAVMEALMQLDAVEKTVTGYQVNNAPVFTPPARPVIPRPTFAPPQNVPPPQNFTPPQPPNSGFNRNPGMNPNRGSQFNRPGFRGPNGPSFPNRRGGN